MLSFESVIQDLFDSLGFDESEQKEYKDKFVTNLNAQAIKDLIDTLSDEKRKELLSSQDLEAEIKNHFTETEIKTSFKESARKSVDQYLKDIEPTLNKEQKNKLQEFSKRLQGDLSDSLSI
ncbi:hypothetical protein HY024_04755 [Candidatus Curtissbacteria bacterium]|nr:hypothetical protein [Candidatus Curtissbacteria bacterium]